MIYVVNKKRKDESIKKEFPNADILDLTSNLNMLKSLAHFIRMEISQFHLRKD